MLTLYYTLTLESSTIAGESCLIKRRMCPAVWRRLTAERRDCFAWEENPAVGGAELWAAHAKSLLSSQEL